MKRTTGLLLLLSLLLLVVSSCLGLPSQRHLVEFPRKDGPPIQCYEPPPDVIAKGGRANTELMAEKFGTFLKGTGGVGLDVERIRQELPADVSAFEVFEFRICAQYGNGVLSKEEYHAFTTQIIPAYEKNPPKKPVPNAGVGATTSLVETCGPSFSTKRPAAIFVSYWHSQIFNLRDNRNESSRDLQNLMEVRGRTPVGEAGIDPHPEIIFTLSCMEKMGYLKMEKFDPPRVYGMGHENLRIIFRE